MATKTEERNGADKVIAARNKNLDLAIQQIAKDYGEGAIMRLGDDSIVDIDVIPTGNILIDRALGVGGFPRGRVVEVFGPESSGKTTLMLHVIANAQKTLARQDLLPQQNYNSVSMTFNQEITPWLDLVADGFDTIDGCVVLRRFASSPRRKVRARSSCPSS